VADVAAEDDVAGLDSAETARPAPAQPAPARL